MIVRYQPTQINNARDSIIMKVNDSVNLTSVCLIVHSTVVIGEKVTECHPALITGIFPFACGYRKEFS